MADTIAEGTGYRAPADVTVDLPLNGLASENESRWYVARAHEGQESSAVHDLKEAIDPVLLSGCFVPMVLLSSKQQGEWVQAEEPLMPGYLVVKTDDPEGLSWASRRISGLVHTANRKDAFIPLSEMDARWLEAQTSSGTQAIGMSEGHVEDGALHVTSGPLLGREAWVRKVNHRKKVVYLEIEAFGRTIQAQAGMRITRRREQREPSEERRA